MVNINVLWLLLNLVHVCIWNVPEFLYASNKTCAYSKKSKCEQSNINVSNMFGTMENSRYG